MGERILMIFIKPEGAGKKLKRIVPETAAFIFVSLSNSKQRAAATTKPLIIVPINSYVHVHIFKGGKN